MTTSDRLTATYHASLRYLERISPRDPHPEESMREMMDRARRICRDDVDGEAYRDPQTKTILVTDERAGEIVTLWPEATWGEGGV